MIVILRSISQMETASPDNMRYPSLQFTYLTLRRRFAHSFREILTVELSYELKPLFLGWNF